jgi:hypothetical protein
MLEIFWAQCHGTLCCVTVCIVGVVLQLHGPQFESTPTKNIFLTDNISRGFINHYTKIKIIFYKPMDIFSNINIVIVVGIS